MQLKPTFPTLSRARAEHLMVLIQCDVALISTVTIMIITTRHSTAPVIFRRNVYTHTDLRSIPDRSGSGLRALVMHAHYNLRRNHGLDCAPRVFNKTLFSSIKYCIHYRKCKVKRNRATTRLTDSCTNKPRPKKKDYEIWSIVWIKVTSRFWSMSGLHNSSDRINKWSDLPLSLKMNICVKLATKKRNLWCFGVDLLRHLFTHEERKRNVIQ